MFARIRNLLVEHSIIAGCPQVIAQHLKRPDNNIAVTFFLLDRRVFVEHEPLRPVPVIFILMGEYREENLPDLLIFVGREEIFHRTLAYITRPPGSAAILFQAVWYRIVNKHIMGVPPGQSVHLEQLSLSSAFFSKLEAIHDAGKKLTILRSLGFKRCNTGRTSLSIKQPLEG
ncbi:hypothetical protein D3C81_1453710 [compost metagenome]